MNIENQKTIMSLELTQQVPTTKNKDRILSEVPVINCLIIDFSHYANARRTVNLIFYRSSQMFSTENKDQLVSAFEGHKCLAPLIL